MTDAARRFCMRMCLLLSLLPPAVSRPHAVKLVHLCRCRVLAAVEAQRHRAALQQCWHQWSIWVLRARPRCSRCDGLGRSGVVRLYNLSRPQIFLAAALPKHEACVGTTYNTHPCTTLCCRAPAAVASEVAGQLPSASLRLFLTESAAGAAAAVAAYSHSASAGAADTARLAVAQSAWRRGRLHLCTRLVLPVGEPRASSAGAQLQSAHAAFISQQEHAPTSFLPLQTFGAHGSEASAGAGGASLTTSGCVQSPAGPTLFPRLRQLHFAHGEEEPRNEDLSSQLRAVQQPQRSLEAQLQLKDEQLWEQVERRQQAEGQLQLNSEQLLRVQERLCGEAERRQRAEGQLQVQGRAAAVHAGAAAALAGAAAGATGSKARSARAGASRRSSWDCTAGAAAGAGTLLASARTPGEYRTCAERQAAGHASNTGQDRKCHQMRSSCRPCGSCQRCSWLWHCCWHRWGGACSWLKQSWSSPEMRPMQW